MKKILSLITALALVFTLTGCGSKEETPDKGEEELTGVAAVIKEAEGLSFDELVAKAKEEVGDNTVKTYGNSSQLEKALTAFTEMTGIKIENTKKGDAEIYTELGEAFGAGRYIADMVLIQDANKLQNEMLAYKYLLNYVPMDQKANIASDDLNPLAAVALNKVFMYNNTDFDGTNADKAKAGALTNYFYNVWQVAGTEADEGHIHNCSFKTPSNENVNMNFLVMLTSDEWCAKLAEAYKAYYGKDYVKEDKYPNIGFKWIAEFLTNSQAHSSDGTACKDLSKGVGGSMCLVNYNKLKSLESTGVGQLDKANLSFPSMELDGKVEGFGGFLFNMYAQVAANAKYPYTACAIINYLTSKEGFEAAWGTKCGYYSTNKTTSIASNDRELAWWKDQLVIEDPEFIASNFRDVFQFVQQYEGK